MPSLRGKDLSLPIILLKDFCMRHCHPKSLKVITECESRLTSYWSASPTSLEPWVSFCLSISASIGLCESWTFHSFLLARQAFPSPVPSLPKDLDSVAFTVQVVESCECNPHSQNLAIWSFIHLLLLRDPFHIDVLDAFFCTQSLPSPSKVGSLCNFFIAKIKTWDESYMSSQSLLLSASEHCTLSSFFQIQKCSVFPFLCLTLDSLLCSPHCETHLRHPTSPSSSVFLSSLSDSLLPSDTHSTSSKQLENKKEPSHPPPKVSPP